MRKLLVVSTVFGWYQDFIPVHVASVLLSYPEYSVRVLVEGKLTDYNLQALDAVRAHIPGLFDVVEGVSAPGRGQLKKASRWLLGKEWFEGYDYAWIGDVDVLLLRENPSLHDSELEGAQRNGWPYHNPIRRRLPGRVHGCMFLIVEPYFEHMQPFIETAREDPIAFKPSGGFHNERFLKHMLAKKFGVAYEAPQKHYPFTRHHGVHLGTLRIGNTYPRWREPEYRQVSLGLLRNDRFRHVRDHSTPRIKGYLKRFAEFLSRK